MPGPNPAVLTNFIGKTREVRPDPVTVESPTQQTKTIRQLHETVKKLAAIAVKKGDIQIPELVLENDSAESKAIRKLSNQIQELAAAYEQLSRMMIEAIRDLQSGFNVTANHLDLG